MTTLITVPWISARSPSLYSCGVIAVLSSRSSCGAGDSTGAWAGCGVVEIDAVGD